MAGTWTVSAMMGGSVNLSGLTTIDLPNATVDFSADGSGSQIDLSALTSDSASSGTLGATNSAALLDGNLTTFSNINISLDGSATIATSKWTSITGGELSISGGMYSLANLTDIDGSSLYVYGGSVSLPGVTSYSTTVTQTFLAEGTGSALNVSALASIASGAYLTVDAESGGKVNLSSVTSLDGATLFDTGNSTLVDSSLILQRLRYRSFTKNCFLVQEDFY